MSRTPAPGTIVWSDLTVPNADRVGDFYRKVVGWKAQGVPMGGYADFAMLPRGSKMAVAGVCHARGVNADLPPVWLIYITVKSLTRSIAACKRAGGRVVAPRRTMGGGAMCVIRDPAGACAALYEPARRRRA